MSFPGEAQLADLSPEQLNGVIAVIMAVGTLYCFLGYRTLRFLIGITGFIIAGATLATLTGWFVDGRLAYMVIAGLIGGVAGAFALTFLYKVGVFSIGMLGAVVAAQNILAETPERWVPLAIILSGGLGGLFALLLEQPVITVASAAIGSWMLVSGVAYFFFDSNWLEEPIRHLGPNGDHTLLVACWAVLAIAGVLAQFATRKRNGNGNEG